MEKYFIFNNIVVLSEDTVFVDEAMISSENGALTPASQRYLSNTIRKAVYENDTVCICAEYSSHTVQVLRLFAQFLAASYNRKPKTHLILLMKETGTLDTSDVYGFGFDMISVLPSYGSDKKTAALNIGTYIRLLKEAYSPSITFGRIFVQKCYCPSFSIEQLKGAVRSSIISSYCNSFFYDNGSGTGCDTEKAIADIRDLLSPFAKKILGRAEKPGLNSFLPIMLSKDIPKSVKYETLRNATELFSTDNEEGYMRLAREAYTIFFENIDFDTSEAEKELREKLCSGLLSGKYGQVKSRLDFCVFLSQIADAMKKKVAEGVVISEKALSALDENCYKTYLTFKSYFSVENCVYMLMKSYVSALLKNACDELVRRLMDIVVNSISDAESVADMTFGKKEYADESDSSISLPPLLNDMKKSFRSIDTKAVFEYMNSGASFRDAVYKDADNIVSDAFDRLRINSIFDLVNHIYVNPPENGSGSDIVSILNMLFDSSFRVHYLDAQFEGTRYSYSSMTYNADFFHDHLSGMEVNDANCSGKHLSLQHGESCSAIYVADNSPDEVRYQYITVTIAETDKPLLIKIGSEEGGCII